MKTLISIVLGTVLLSAGSSCRREMTVEQEPEQLLQQDAVTAVYARKASTSGTCNPNAYVITLESRNQVDGNWEWIWSVYNPNPGNGNNGTAQDLSLWGMQLANCVNLATLVSAAYSSDGINWTGFTPSYQTDPSQGCMTDPVLKFDFGTLGTAKSYYRLVVSQDYGIGDAIGYYKSGNNTGCCTFNFIGIGGCGGPVEIEIVE